jgi:transcription elongation factor Elf1
MIDLSYIWIDFECPECNYQDQIQLIDIKCEKTIYCNNCKISIQLEDNDASTHEGIETINKAFDDLNNLFEKFK